MMPKALGKIKAINIKINHLLFIIAGIALITSMCLVVFNGFLRVFTKPIGGVVEIASWLAAIVTAFSLGTSQINKVHVHIDLLFNKFGRRTQKVVSVFCNLLAIGFFSMLMYQLILYALHLNQTGVLSNTMRIPFYPFVIAVSIGFIGLIITLIIQLFEIIFGEEVNGER